MLTFDEQSQLKNPFWKQIKAVGIPIIEDAPDNKIMVYFLLSRDDLKESTEKPGKKRDVYFQGNFAYQPPSFFPVTPEVRPENKPASKSKKEIAIRSKHSLNAHDILLYFFSYGIKLWTCINVIT